MNGTGNFHGSLAPLAEAAARTRLGVVCVSIPLSPDGALGWPGRGPAAVRHRAILLARHLRFAVAVRRAPARPTLVREFSTIPLLWAATRLWTRRASLRFVVNHNLQWALNENAERVAFRWLDRLGFRFVFFEARPADALTRAGLRPDRHFDLPHPTSGAPAVRPPVGDIPRVGLIGHYRPEKGMDEALGVLLSGAAGRWRAAVGVPNVGEFLRRSPWAARRAEFDVVDTAERAAYDDFLRSCDVVALNYRPRDYAWRASGLLAEAASAGVASVIPDLPAQRIQLSVPTSVGEWFSEGGLLCAVERAVERVRGGAYDFAAYCAARAPEALAAKIDAFFADARGHAATGTCTCTET